MNFLVEFFGWSTLKLISALFSNDSQSPQTAETPPPPETQSKTIPILHDILKNNQTPQSFTIKDLGQIKFRHWEMTNDDRHQSFDRDIIHHIRNTQTFDIPDSSDIHEFCLI
jgi:hypothetical protein